MSAFISALTPGLTVTDRDPLLLEASAPPRPEAEGQPVDDRWTELVRRIHLGEKEAVEELYRYFYGGIRLFLCRHLGPQELEDKVHDTFVIVLTAIRRGEVRDPSRLTSFVRTVVRRQVANHIGGVVHERRDCVDVDTGGEVLVDDRQTPEQRVIVAEQVSIMRELLEQVDDRDRELLVRFYLQEDSVEEICADLNLSCNQFRLLKSRAKVRFGELGRRALARRAFSRFQGHQKFRSIT
jgi:RNA polymerase sigma-70 factor, ECF subfamily